MFKINDIVKFYDCGEMPLTGTIIKLTKKYAKVKCYDGFITKVKIKELNFN